MISAVSFLSQMHTQNRHHKHFAVRLTYTSVVIHQTESVLKSITLKADK